MNAVSNSDRNFTEENAETDTIPDESPEYYEPLSNGDVDSSDNEQESNFQNLLNGDVENGISDLDLSSEENEEQEEESVREAIQRAFREDEMRRRAPLSVENTRRVMEAMRGISFGELAPDWAARVSEDRWMDQLARIRQSPSSS